MAFLNELIDNEKFKNNFHVDSIYGTSFGALVGYFFCINKLEILREFFMSLDENSLQPHFNFWGYGPLLKKVPVFGKLFEFCMDVVWLLKSVKEKSFFIQESTATELLKTHSELTAEERKQLDKFYCCVYNITKQRIEYINGSHKLITEYMLASSALWILFKPRLIRQLKTECSCNNYCKCNKVDKHYQGGLTDVQPINAHEYPAVLDNEELCTCEKHQYNEYIDGGLLKSIPYDSNFDGTRLVLTTRDIEKVARLTTGKHLFEYLDNIISFLTEYNQSLDIQYVNKDWHKDSDVHLINYKSEHNNPAILNKKIIEGYIFDGQRLANEFLNSITQQQFH
jgi:predicted acylesterase/phospholipase RssA